MTYYALNFQCKHFNTIGVSQIIGLESGLPIKLYLMNLAICYISGWGRKA